MVPTRPQFVVDRDGATTLDGRSVRIPNILLKKEIGRGANAAVFLGESVFLKRQLAVKIWLPSKQPHDRRDKFQQGVLEAQKVSSFDDPHIVKVFDAGEASGVFYVSMEIFAGVTLREWLSSSNPDLELRLGLADDLFRGVIDMTHRAGILHGDLHCRNILIDPEYGRPSGSVRQPTFKVIDFGTSYFSGPAFSVPRHWRILEETLDSILFPLRIRPLWGHLKPSSTAEARRMDEWIEGYLRNIGTILQIAFQGSSPHELAIFEFPRQGHKRLRERREVTLTQGGLDFLKKLIASDALSIEEAFRIFPPSGVGP